MKNPFLLLLGLLVAVSLSEAQPLKDPDAFLIKEDRLPRILLVGSFHFEYYNRDAHTVDKDKQVDILSAKKQQEMAELVAYLAQFKPTKIVIEAPESWNMTQKYWRYRTGHTPLGRDEASQIAFRLANQFQLDTLYAADAVAVDSEMEVSADSVVFKKYLATLFQDYDFKSEDEFSKRYVTFFKYETELSMTLSLLDYFKFINSPKVLQREYGSYLTGDFKLGKYRGADALALYWYNRNLRIFRNIQRVITSADDRILVLYGRGHVSVLNQLLMASPQYEYVRFNDLPSLK